MATFNMATRGPASLNVPTLDMAPIGPKVKRPRPKFMSPGQHWDFDLVEADEYGVTEIIDMTPEATYILAQLPDDWRAEGERRAANLEEPTDAAIVESAITTTIDAIAAKLGMLQLPELPFEGVQPQRVSPEEAQALEYIKTHQDEIRQQTYSGITEAIARGYGPILGLGPPTGFGGPPIQDIRWR